jgi:tetratricopeptide (TPR) repeat protein
MEVKVKMTFMKIALEDQDGYDLESLDVGVPIWAHLGSLFVKRKAYELAAFAYEKVIIGRPEDSLIKNNLAWCYYSLGDFSRAESIIREAHLLDPRNNEIIHTYSQVLRKSKKYQECKNLLQPIIAKSLVDPRHNFSLAVIYEELGQVSEALFEYNKALANSSEGHWTLAQSKKALEAKIATLTKSIK